MQHLVLDGEVDVYYLCDFDEAENAFAQVFASKPNLLGLDTETTVGQEKEALLQLATEGVVYVYPILNLSFGVYPGGKEYSSRLPPSLKKILNSPNIIKSGVDIEADALSLNKNYSLNLRGVLDLQKVALAMGYKNTSLLQLAKHWNLPLGNKESVKKHIYKIAWDKQLSDRYLEYAARDAHLSLELARKMLVRVD
nr:ribonuclease H [Cedratvirus borely]